MEMFESVSSVLANMGRCVLFGFCAGLPFEVISVWDKKRRPSPRALFAADLGCCISVAFAFFILLLAFADGSLRLGWFICAGGGAVLYKLLLSRFAQKSITLIFNCFEAVKGFILRYFLLPLGIFTEKAFNILIKPLKFLLKHIKITVIRLKNEKVRKKISGRKRKWRQEQSKMLKAKAGCRE